MDQPPLVSSRLRKNGRLQSCEPCRKSKLRCDHAQPVCGRCALRKRREQCVYHPAPLTRLPGTPRRAASASPGQAIGDAGPTPTPASAQAPLFTQPGPPPDHRASISTSNFPSPQLRRPSEPAHATPQTASASWGRSPESERSQSISRPKNAGFVGETSVSNIFSEGLANVGEEDVQTPRAVTITADRLQRGCRALVFLKDRALIEKLVYHWFDINEGSGGLTPLLFAREWLEQLWAHYGDVVASQNPAAMNRLCELIWQNTHTPLRFTGETTGLEFARLGTGLGLRWEVVGILAALVGLTAVCLPDSSNILVGYKLSKKEIIKAMAETINTCLAFCRECEGYDDLYIILVLETGGFCQATKGPRHYDTYVAVGEGVAYMLATGLHQGIKQDKDTPFFLAQLRQRGFAIAYVTEVSIASFLGRPSRLMYRYCVFDLPLELDDDQIFLEGEELQAVLAQLDENGYNVAVGRKLHRLSRGRVWFNYARPREDSLDLALADYSREEVLARAEKIYATMEADHAALPRDLADNLRADAILLGPGGGSADGKPAMRPLEALELAQLRQSRRANETILERVLIRKTGAGPERLLQLARATLADVLAITGRLDLASQFQVDMSMLMVGNGMRSAAILAVELLKQEQRLQEGAAGPMLLPRSEMIQQLSVFASRLATVDPAEGTYEMCEQGRRMLSRILDKILTPGAVVSRAEPATPRHENAAPGLPLVDPASALICDPAADSHFMGTVPVSFDLDGDLDFTQWLGGMDWELSNALGGF